MIKVKVLDDGTVIYADPFSNDLVQIDTEMKELARLKGVAIPDSLRESAADFNKNRKTCFSDDGNYVLWLKGLNQISIVDTDSFQEQEIPNFFTHDQSVCFALMAVGDSEMKKIMGFGYNNIQ